VENLQDGRAGKITTIAEVRSSHHVLWVEHLLGKFWNSDGAERVSATAGERSETNHEEMETWERNHVDGQLAEIRVELTWEAKTSGHARHNGGNQVVEIAIRWVVQLKCAHANVVQSLVINAESLVRVLDQLMDRESGVVWLNNCVRYFRGWDDGECGHHAVWEFLADLGDQKSSHTSTSTTSKRVCDLETLKAITSFSFTSDNIQDLVDKFGTLGVMTLGPVVSGTRLSKDKVVRTEKLTEWTSTDSVHGTWFEIDEDGTGDIFVVGSL
jgi:hypothetical protein